MLFPNIDYYAIPSLSHQRITEWKKECIINLAVILLSDCIGKSSGIETTLVQSVALLEVQ